MPPYEAMPLTRLAQLLGTADGETRWRLLAEFLEEYAWERAHTRRRLLMEEPDSTGDHRWDVLLGALAEHLAAWDGCAGPDWAEHRRLRQFWFPYNTAAARVDAFVHAPAAFRRRGVFLAAQELEVA